MKVSDVKQPSAQLIQQYQKNGNVKLDAERQVSGAAVPEEKVDLSTKAKDIQNLKSAVANLPDVREEKVQELRNRIESGKYNVSGEEIAEKMVGEALLDIFA
ncbi:MAG: flagellar biosynthesis anti-sigma factor FlgM [Deltaproteobacteria bacterium]|nr:flagellar biosynthesis anti-sigma factor FlgM [Deltaproteobacteria bacterium]